MCMFSAKVREVGDTQIFARGSNEGRQFVVYSMKYEAEADLAMILPLPVPPAPPEDAVRFIDLSGYENFFDDLRLGFPEMYMQASRGVPKPASRHAPLKVHDVGSFEASFVPALKDFNRLDARFRLSDKVWKSLPRYADYGFAVFKLKPGAKKIHPMAFEFPRRNPIELFFPTVHVHDGKVSKLAHFDHMLFCQIDQQKCDWDESFDFLHNSGPWLAQNFMQIDKAQGIIDPARSIRRRTIQGLHLNEDVVLT